MSTCISNKEFYTQQINLVKNYINDNLDQKISVKQLAEISCFSSFHFHRISRALLGEPIGSYINRIRLEKACKLIQYSNNTMEDIAFSIGFESSSSFSKAFKNQYGISPTGYKNQQLLIIKKTNIMETTLNIKRPKIVTTEKKQCIYYALQGPYQSLNYSEAWKKLWQEVKSQKLFTAGIEHIGIPYDDPNTTDAKHIRYDACLVVHKTPISNAEIGVKTLNAGKFATFLYTGSYKYLSEVYDYIFNNWLLNSDHELRDANVREQYKNNPERTEESKLKTEIWIPIK